jgi:hypothetical protein
MSRFKRCGVVLFVILASACGANSTTSPSPTTTSTTSTATTFTLSGQVTNSASAAPVSGATVSIADSVNAGKSVTTDGSGNYSFTGLQQAGFTVNVTASGYGSSSKGVTLTSNQTLSFQLVQQVFSFVGTWAGVIPNNAANGTGGRVQLVLQTSNLGTFTLFPGAGSPCGVASLQITFTANFSTGQFTISGSSPVTGRTVSATSAVGTVAISAGTSCSVINTTWTATKQ